MIPRRVITACLTLAFLALGGCGMLARAPEPATPNAPWRVYYRGDQPILQVQGEPEFKVDKYTSLVTGRARNVSDSKVAYVEFEFQIFDKQGETLDHMLDTTNNLSPGEVWAFQARSIEPWKDVFKGFKLVGVTVKFPGEEDLVTLTKTPH